ncbi:diacylglycerol O-acyltransferase [Actinokineospora bangkokensis]|uniref:Diacylglycerol O-acyltransferase n=2 Tax=Actinokineospora bangkokensis TaxID=1193682 RepID=A0A1Q9LH84_9PSEU|nr:diacylglycerol O-acyltransferase [Actinokineospora bangkokensis]
MPPTDSMFLLGETREHPLHVGGLQLFELPEGAGPDHIIELHRDLLSHADIRPLFRRRPRSPLGTPGQWAWANDDNLDLEYHVRLSALPRPGRVRELLELVSRLHGSLLDRHRPLWECHLIEGLEDNRYAVYTKAHHALLDGVSALRLLEDTLSTDPADRGVRPPWSPRVRTDATAPPPHREPEPFAGLVSAANLARDLLGLGPAVLRYVNQAFQEQSATLPHETPKSILNVPITGARRFAAQGWPLTRIRAVGAAAGATVNDVMLAMCAGALRTYLLELGALPDKPLVAAVPISLREGDGVGGNAVGIILCTLATDLDDPAARLAAITASMQRGKDFYRGMTPLQVTALSAIPFTPLALSLLPGAAKITPPAFNLLISNVPGPAEPLYWNGARMTGVYPVSIPYEGQALNITVTSYAGTLEFGLTGCRRSVPRLQRLLTFLEDSLAAMEKTIL